MLLSTHKSNRHYTQLSVFVKEKNHTIYTLPKSVNSIYPHISMIYSYSTSIINTHNYTQNFNILSVITII